MRERTHLCKIADQLVDRSTMMVSNLYLNLVTMEFQMSFTFFFELHSGDDQVWLLLLFFSLVASFSFSSVIDLINFETLLIITHRDTINSTDARLTYVRHFMIG